MKTLWLYSALSRFKFLNYRSKIMVVAFTGTHIPLIAIVAHIAWRSTDNWQSFLSVLSTALVATLGGTALTLLALIHLLRPIILTSQALREYGQSRKVLPLPTHFDDQVGTLMADTVSTLTDLEEARRILEHVDADTGLANRTKLISEIAAAVEAGKMYRVCVVVSNGYQRVATTMNQGHADKVMKMIGDRLDAFLGADAVLARIAPGQFAFLSFEDFLQEGQSLNALRSLIQECGGKLSLGDVNIQPNLAGGISTYPTDSSDPEELLDFAAAASDLVGARSPVAAYLPQMRVDAFDRYRVEEDIKLALKRDEFELYFQPVVAADEGRAVGGEALIRWNHPERGLVRPDQFIPIAESSDLISEIGLWVMDAACKQVGAWQNNDQRDLKVAINLSARQFHDPLLLDHVKGFVNDHKIDPQQLEIELTESSLMDDFDQSRVIFGGLRDLGVGISIDDFGTGFASLSYLRRLPFNKLKLDREFVDQVDTKPESQAICKALIALSEGLHLDVLAEGTERAEEITYLRELGCNLFQGYYLSKPVSANDFVASIEQGRLRSLLEKAAKTELRAA